MVSLTGLADLRSDTEQKKVSVAQPRLPVHRQIERAELRLEQYRISLFLTPGDAKTKYAVQGIEDALATVRGLLAPSTNTIN
jgi:hypothetical protein